MVLPQPDGPSRAKNDPAGIVRSSSSMAVNPGALLDADQLEVGASLGEFATDITTPEDLLELAWYFCSSAPGERAEDVVCERLLVGKISWFSASSGSIADAASCAPTTGDVVHPRGDLGATSGS